MTPAVECDAAVALLFKEQHLTIPCIGIERPTVREGDDWACSPVLEIDFCAVFGCDRAHVLAPFRSCGLWSQRFARTPENPAGHYDRGGAMCVRSAGAMHVCPPPVGSTVELD